jgi:hypothetical protein
MYSDGVSVTHDVGALPEAIRVQCMLLGFKNKIVDPFAGKADDGIAACREASSAVVTNLVAGQWDSRGAKLGFGVWVEAVHRVAAAAGKTQTLDQVAEVWKKMDEKNRAIVRKNAAVLIAKNAIEGERLAARASTATDDIETMFE